MDAPAPGEQHAPVEAFGRSHLAGLVTLLFTDMVDSTALKQKLGDHAGAVLLQQHHRLVRTTLAEFPEGELMDAVGDAFFVVFATPSAAVRFALILQKRLREFNEQARAPMQDRMGLHLGEVLIREAAKELEKGLVGLNVDLGARVMSLAQGGQILLSRPVFDSARQALKGEDIAGIGPLSWLNHGLYQLKGIDEAVEICEVGETGTGALRAPVTTEKAKRVEAVEGEQVLGWRPALGQEVPNTPWVLEGKLGEGGFGEVWVARHQKLKERRVFKFCFRADRVRALKREMTLFRLLKEHVGDHPNIVRLHEVYLDKAPFYLEEEYVEGKDLKCWCEAQGGIDKVPQAVRLAIIAQAAEALQAAHDAGVIHRDVKPGNILVSGEPSGAKPLVVKLTDFGIGQVVSAEALAGVTRAGFTQTILGSTSSQTGTQLYMAPELLAGKPASTRSDIYSLGVVLYQLLVGDFSRPVTGEWAEEIADPLLREDLKHCLVGKPEDRFTGVGQLAKNLRALPERRAEWDRREAEKAALERAAYRRGMIRTAGVATVILAAIAGLALVALQQSRRAEKGEQKARESELATRRRAYAADMNLAQQSLALNNIGRAGELLNRHRPLAGEQDLRGWEWRYLWQQCRSDALRTVCQRSNEIWSLAVSSDGKWVAAGEAEGGLSVWDLTTGQEVVRLAESTDSVKVAFSPRERLLAFSVVKLESGKPRHRVCLWNGTSRKITAELALGGLCMGLAFTEDGQRLVSYAGNPANEVTLWEVPTGTRLSSYPTPPFKQTGIEGNHFAMDPQGKVAAVGPDNTIHVIDLTTGKERWAKKATEESVKALALSPDGKVLASGAGFIDSAIRLWDMATGQEISRLQGHRVWVSALVFWPDGKTLASASGDQTIRLWDLTDVTHVPLPRILRGHTLEVWELALLPDGRTLASGCKDGSVHLWDTTSIQHEGARAILPAGIPVLGSWRLSPDSASVFTVDGKGRVTRWTGTCFRDSESWMDLVPPPGSRDLVLISQDARRVAVGSTNGLMKVWDLQQRALLRQFQVSTKPVMPLEFLGQGKSLLINLNDGSTQEWNLATGQKVRAWGALPYAPRIFFGFSTDGLWLVFILPDGASELREIATQRDSDQTLDIKGVNGVSFSPDGRIFAAASTMGYAKLWDRATLRQLAVLRGFLMGIHSVAFSPDNRRLAAGSDGTEAVKLWDVDSGQELLTLGGQGSLFWSTAFSADGNVVGSCNEKGALHLWRAPSWAEIEAAEKPEASGLHR